MILTNVGIFRNKRELREKRRKAMPQNRISKGAAFLLCVTTAYNDANMVTAMGTEVDGTAVTGF